MILILILDQDETLLHASLCDSTAFGDVPTEALSWHAASAVFQDVSCSSKPNGRLPSRLWQPQVDFQAGHPPPTVTAPRPRPRPPLSRQLAKVWYSGLQPSQLVLFEALDCQDAVRLLFEVGRGAALVCLLAPRRSVTSGKTGSNKLGVAGAKKFISWLKSKPDIEIAVRPSCSNPCFDFRL